ncbi:class A beta-lactamase-related serine hydrolase [Thalassotalea sp. HSM 43]|uniref:serine hydrolase domain-containing protein n=1 Tax=Thalassotalea sp. HSM 43 TaxID=2552945 RepID=UPI0010808CA1|nr:serine hydrolase domain-containing protein [Thalassotalea sp. HSM 43]QBY05235.1 class A beta-lactamase-related serine hydrolase [Thalassotalea sp. HSM 43]
MNIKRLSLLTSIIVASSSFFIVKALAEQNPMEAALQVDGAKVNLSVEAAKHAYTPEFIDAARANFSNFHWQMGGDHALYYNMHMNEFMPTAIASPHVDYKPLPRNINAELDDLKVQTSAKGEMTMAQYLADPQFRTQGFMLIHKGEVVYESYPGMKPSDRHIWTSAAKTSVGLVVAQLVDEGKIDPQKPVPVYVPELKGTVWEDVRVLDLLNHTTGLDNEETLQSILNPDSPVVRFFAAGFGSPRHSTGQVESWMDVALDTEKLPGEKAGEHFRYASLNTTVLTQMVENIENTSWVKVFEDRVWSKMTARQPALFNLTPDGMALPVGLMSTTLEDMARYGTLFTPSWPAVATEQVVSADVLHTIKTSGDEKTHENSSKQLSSVGIFNEMTSSQSYQFDFIFADGAIGKSGNLGQFLYIDSDRDFVGVVFSTNPYHSGFGESKAPALMRSAAKQLAGK